MSARHDLAAELSAAAEDGIDVTADPLHYADWILAAGWRPPPRTVTTVEELDALPYGSLVVNSFDDVSKRRRKDIDGLGWVSRRGGYQRSSQLVETGPLTVLREGRA